MDHMSTGTWATDPELDDALARAIRQLIAEAIEVGGAAGADSASTAALAGAPDPAKSQATARARPGTSPAGP
jgi:hypothetical protein